MVDEGGEESARDSVTYLTVTAVETTRSLFQRFAPQADASGANAVTDPFARLHQL